MKIQVPQEAPAAPHEFQMFRVQQALQAQGWAQEPARERELKAVKFLVALDWVAPRESAQAALRVAVVAAQQAPRWAQVLARESQA